MSSKKISSRAWSLSARLTIWYIAASLTLAACTMGGLYSWLRSYLANREEPILTDKVKVVREILRDRPDATLELRKAVELNYYEVPTYLRLLNEDGQPALATEGMDEILPQSAFDSVLLSESTVRRSTDIRSLDGVSFRAVVARAVVGKSAKNWTIQAARYNAHHKMLLANFRLGIMIMLAATAIVCPLVAYTIARRGLRPVHEISETARNISSETLSERIEAAGYPVELGALAGTFNAMLDRLEESFRRISRFSADIAHELRTPIQNLRGAAEVTLSRTRSIEEYKEALTSCLEETVRVSQLIERLLLLARVENPGTHLKLERVNLAEELADVREYYANAAADAGVALSIIAREDLVIALDRSLMRGAIGNLVANALAHTPAGGAITLAAQVEDGYARIEVSDTGTGIAAEDLPHVFDRFYRADRSRSSHAGSMGLGLAIVKGIVSLHGGHTEIVSEVGKGTRVALRFPLNSVSRAEMLPAQV